MTTSVCIFRSSIAAVGSAIAVIAVVPGVAHGDPQTKFVTSGGPAKELRVGVDISPGLWVGTSLVDYPGNCSLIRFRTYPSQYTEAGISDTLMSEIGTPLTYRLTPGGAITLGRDCVWALIAS
jgi:hypothetical protein